ncbi:hypothetical protein WJX72_001311 [[Myrmecia] bisecta]|uniref:Uncharacterized protein n=1 Tax=[Myrmecia] bisecta TaxID=41462 RepID=A0AAW1PH71_9CHLO
MQTSTPLSGRTVVRGTAAPKRALLCRPIAAVQGPREARKAEQQIKTGLLATLAAAQLALLPLAGPAFAGDLADNVQDAAQQVDQKTDSLPSIGDVARNLQDKLSNIGQSAPDVGNKLSDTVGKAAPDVSNSGEKTAPNPFSAGGFDTDNSSPESKIKALGKQAQNAASGDLSEAPSINPNSKNLGPNEVSKKTLGDLPNANKFDQKAPGRSGRTFGNPGAAEVGKNAAQNAVDKAGKKVKSAFDLSAAPADDKPSINRESENLGPNEVDSRLIKEFPNANEVDTSAPGRGGRTFGNPKAAEVGENPATNADVGSSGQGQEAQLKEQLSNSKKSGNFFSNFFNLGKGT